MGLLNSLRVVKHAVLKPGARDNFTRSDSADPSWRRTVDKIVQQRLRFLLDKPSQIAVNQQMAQRFVQRVTGKDFLLVVILTLNVLVREALMDKIVE